MDNVCHTFVGLAAARTGLNSTSRYATATLAIASNLPDIDALAFVADVPVVALRRGWTHGVLAQAVLPVAFAGVMWMLARRTAHRAPPSAHSGRRTAHFGWLTLLSYIGVLSHVGLDYLNNYGVRLLMPFSDRWFYGDSVFIVDIWMWLMLGAGVFLARRGRRWIAGAGIAAAAVYIALMVVSASRARAIVMDRWIETFGAPPASLMVGPMPLTPLRKNIIVDAGDGYVVGRFHWFPRHVNFNPAPILKNDMNPWVARAREQEPDFDYILVWARFPYYELEQDPKGVRVTLRDARFPRGIRGFSATTYVQRQMFARVR